MLRGLYTAASGLIASLRKSEVTANNLANVNTFGYKKQETLSKSFKETLINRIDYQKVNSKKTPIGVLGKGVIIDEVYTDFKQGNIVSTNNQLDLALEGSGYLVVQDEEEKEFFTRNGSLKLNNEGYLETQTGHLILGEKGPIKVEGANININEVGEVTVDGEYLDKLKIVDLEEPRQIGDSLFTARETLESTKTQVRQGFIETSNVNAIDEMIKVINVHRSYEMNQKMVQAYDNTLEKAINEVPSA